MIGILERESGPDKDEKRYGDQGVLEAFPRVHPDLAKGGSGGGRGGGAEAESSEFSDPISGVVEEHEPDNEGNQEQIELPGIPGLPGFSAAFGHMDGADGEAGAGAGVALAASLGEVLGVDGGLGVRGRKNLVEAVTRGAVGDGLGAGAGGEAVKGGAKGGDAVRGHAETASEAKVAVAAAAGLADGGAVDGGAVCFRTKDGVLAMAIGANRRFGDARGAGFAVNAGMEVLENAGVTEAAVFGDGVVERGGLGGFGFMGLVVTGAAGRSGGITGRQLFAVNGAAMLAGLSGVAGGAGWFGQIFRVGKIPMFRVALGAGSSGVGRSGDNFLLFLMAALTIDGRGLGG